MSMILGLIAAVIAAIGLRIYLEKRKRNKSEETFQITDQPSEDKPTAILANDTLFPKRDTKSASYAVEISKITKSYGDKKAVDNVSFNIKPGEILGMVGPNGAGKTTTIRMMMDIIKPDSGDIKIMGELLSEDAKDHIGYLPEERGLYKKITVTECLSYLASLKGIEAEIAKERANELLNRVNMLQHKDKKVEGLSRGMSQIIQLVSTILHDPDLIVLDEPFSGLDPVNTQVLREFIIDLRNQGRSIILSSHMMNQVEEVCDRVLMINRGQAVLYGTLDEIRSQYRSNSVIVECENIPDNIPGVVEIKDHNKHIELFLDEKTSSQDVLNTLVSRGVKVNKFELSMPSLNEIFIRVAKGQQ